MKNPLCRVRFTNRLPAAPKAVMIFLSGGVGYGLIEVLWRGRTHPSMVITGGACLLIIKLLTHALKERTVIFRCLLGTLAVTAVEFAVGCVVNLWMDLSVWDYSRMSYNILGQICPEYSALWFFICSPLVMIFSLAEQKTSKKRDENPFHFRAECGILSVTKASGRNATHGKKTA